LSAADIWQVEYKLYIKFACTYLREYNTSQLLPDDPQYTKKVIQHGFLTTVYGGDLKGWSLEHMKELTTRASKLRYGRKLDDSVIKELKSLDGYRQLIKLMKG
jgi:hypothetical protein